VGRGEGAGVEGGDDDDDRDDGDDGDDDDDDEGVAHVPTDVRRAGITGEAGGGVGSACVCACACACNRSVRARAGCASENGTEVRTTRGIVLAL
jgi:hypothetical protein